MSILIKTAYYIGITLTLVFMTDVIFISRIFNGNTLINTRLEVFIAGCGMLLILPNLFTQIRNDENGAGYIKYSRRRFGVVLFGCGILCIIVSLQVK